MEGSNSFAGLMDALEVLVLLGGDLGDQVINLAGAERLIGERAGKVLARSRDHWTEPWGFKGDALFLNRALLLRTSLPPVVLMDVFLAIETELGRDRTDKGRYGSRTVDIDILLVGGQVIGSSTLQVPHPRFHERSFALAPAADIVPGWVHPVQGLTVLQLLNALRHDTAAA
ncbi:MAG: 2-amino-4-hydroxy-6-hydroxymethyldihydropteridine diphosphokinase [Flavobacteriales bacterium]|nr:2-amino-4-hydroxy-6-hydroxymethyldihydropteridine diphosphokinase [Flavobacteriales bacterium]